MPGQAEPPLARERIGVIVLAAGSSRRFPSDKRLALMPDNKELLASTLASIPVTFSRRLLVLRPGDEALARRFEQAWEICFAPRAHLGMGHSLAYAVSELEDWQGAVIALGDMPFVHPDTYTAVQEALCIQPLVRPFYRGQPGHPVGFQAAYFSELAALQGDEGARSLLARHSDKLHQHPSEDPGILRDIDTPGNARP